MESWRCPKRRSNSVTGEDSDVREGSGSGPKDMGEGDASSAIAMSSESGNTHKVRSEMGISWLVNT